jgi:hypothetical protein
MAATIKVEQTGTGEPAVFNITVEDAGGKSRHRVTLTATTYQKLTGGRVTQQACIEAAFRYLLERESKTDILPSFDLNVIQMYFPDFEEDLPRYL